MVLWPASLAGRGDLNGFNVSPTKVGTVTIGVGFGCNDSTYDYMIASSAFSANLAASGAGGLDTGSEASSTWYYVWVIGNAETGAVAGMFSLSSAAPTMPAGYTLKRRVGEVRNDAGSDFLDFFQ